MGSHSYSLSLKITKKILKKLNSDNTSIGVLGSDYAEERLKKTELKFRYRTRARIVYDSVNEFLRRTSGLNVVDYGAAEGLTMLEMANLFPKSNFLGVEYAEDFVA